MFSHFNFNACNYHIVNYLFLHILVRNILVISMDQRYFEALQAPIHPSFEA